MFRKPTHPVTLAACLAVVAVLTMPVAALAASGGPVKVEGVDLHCSFETADAIAGLDAVVRDRSDAAGFAFIDVGVEPKDPAAPIVVGGMDDPPLTKDGLSTTFEMFNDATGEAIGSATVSATFTVTDSQHVVAIYQNAYQKGTFYTLRAAGTLSVTAGTAHYAFDLAGCDASAQSRLDYFRDVKPPKPGAKVPGNDLPTSALAVAAGSHVLIQTDGASPPSEADCIQTFDDGDFDLPFGRTVWFEIVGNGQPITVDPVGSDFDTAVAAYVQTSAGLEQVACIDDGTGPLGTPKQAGVTIDSQPGATYLVQIGGLGAGTDAQFGTLRVEVY